MKYYIWSNEHKQWWKPNSMGYTPLKENAGQYGLDDALDTCIDANEFSGDVPNETMVPVIE
jgi:hypothetical protein